MSQLHPLHQAASPSIQEKKLHERELNSWLQDNDMSTLMPKPTNAIEILGPFSQANLEQFEVNNLLSMFNNQDIKHIMMPIVDQGHWCGVYISKVEDKPDKPDKPDKSSKYIIEIFDSNLNHQCRDLSMAIKKTIQQCGIDEASITLEITHPDDKTAQTDSYSCGDYVCAYSHKKMQIFGVTPNADNQRFIHILNSQGNRNNALRNISREIIQTHTIPETIYNEHKATVKAEHATIYKQTLSDLIQSRGSIFDKSQNSMDADEKLAATLQTEEFVAIGLKMQ